MNRISLSNILFALCGLCLLCPAWAGAQDAQLNVLVEDTTVTASMDEAAMGTATTRRGLISSGNDVTITVGESIRLESGFKVEKGATFHAEVDPSLKGGGAVDCPASNPICNVPPTLPNFRLGGDAFVSGRPVLSLNGFAYDRARTGCGA